MSFVPVKTVKSERLQQGGHVTKMVNIQKTINSVA
jgi:hypothetical protein